MSAPSTTATGLTDHLEFLGYSVTRRSDSLLIGEHATKPNIVLSTFGGGVVLRIAYKTKGRARSNRPGLLEFINRLNERGNVCHYSIGEDYDFFIGAMYLGDYDRPRFAQFLEMVFSDHGAVFELPEFRDFLE